jgi:hypothetical protein
VQLKLQKHPNAYIAIKVFFSQKNVTKFMGHHYAIWASASNISLAQKKIRASQRLTLISGTVVDICIHSYIAIK